MIKVNTRDGRTIGFDLSTEDGLAAWREIRSSPTFQHNITGIAIHHDGWQHAIPLPVGLVRADFDADIMQPNGRAIGEFVTLAVDDFRITFTLYFSGVSRIDLLRRVWRQRFTPPK